MIAAGLVSLLATAGVGLNFVMPQKMAAEFVAELRNRGFGVTWQNISWSPLDGLDMQGVRVRVLAGDGRPFFETANLHFQVSLREYVGLAEEPRFWRIDDSTVKLGDAQGTVTLDHVSLSIKSRPQHVEVRGLRASKDGLVAELKGTVILDRRKGPTTEPYPVRLEALRTVLRTLVVREGPFRVSGEFYADRTGQDLNWKAKLDGNGGDLQWHGIPLTHATAKADLSSEHSLIRCELRNKHASTQATLTREDWKESPLRFEGELMDPSGVSDHYEGHQLNHMLTVDRLKGSADLCVIAEGIPKLAGHCPRKLRFNTFPQIDARNFKHQTGSETWTLESASVRSEEVTFLLDEDEIEAHNLTALASYDGEAWNIDKSRVKVLGGEIAAAGRLSKGQLRKATVTIDGIGAGQLARATGHEAPKKLRGDVTGMFHGLVDFANSRLIGKGSLTMEDAPVIEVPLLDQVAELFAGAVPGMDRPKDGRFEADFEADEDLVHVHRFEAKGGTVTVSAKGTIDLQKERVHGVARGKLTGLPGVLTSPLSRLLEMEVEGPFDDIRVKPMGPAKLASNAASGTVGVAVDTMEEKEKITGTVIKEGIQLPWRWIKKKQGDRARR